MVMNKWCKKQKTSRLTDELSQMFVFEKLQMNEILQ